MRHSKIEKYRLPDESDLSWSLRKEFIERYQGDFPEATLLSLAKVYSEAESGECSSPASVAPTGPVLPQHEQQLKKTHNESEEKLELSTKKKQEASSSRSRPSFKVKKKASANPTSKSGTSFQKRTSHEAFQSNSKGGDKMREVPTKKSRLSDLKSPSEHSNKHHSIRSNSDVTLKGKSLPKNGHEETDAHNETDESDVMDKAKIIALQYSLGEKVLEINTWPKNLKNNFVSILQFVKKCFSKELSTSEILHFMAKRFRLKLQYCTKMLPAVRNRLPVYECKLKVDSIPLGKGIGSTLKKTRIAAAKEVIDKLMKLSREVGNLSLSYFNKSGTSVVRKMPSDENIPETDGMNNETEHIACGNELHPTLNGSKAMENPCRGVSLPYEINLTERRADMHCDRRSLVQVKCPTHPADLGSNAAFKMDVEPTSSIDSGSLGHSVADCDTTSSGVVDATPLINENSLGVQQKFYTKVVGESIITSHSSLEDISFSGTTVQNVIEDSKENLRSEISHNSFQFPHAGHRDTLSGNDSKNIVQQESGLPSKNLNCPPETRHNLVINESHSCLENVSFSGTTVQNSIEDSKENLRSEILGKSCQFPYADNPDTMSNNDGRNIVLQESGSLKKSVDCHPEMRRNLVISESHSCLENVSFSDTTVQNSIEDSKENVRIEILRNSCQFPDAGNHHSLSGSQSKDFVSQESCMSNKDLNLCSESRHNSCWDVPPSSLVPKTNTEVHSLAVQNNSKFIRDVGATLDVVRSTVPVQNALDAANYCSATDSSQRNEFGRGVAPNSPLTGNCTPGLVDPRTIKMFNSGCEVTSSVESINLMNGDGRSSFLCESSLSQQRSGKIQGFENLFQTNLSTGNTRILSLAFRQIETFIFRLEHPSAMFVNLSRSFCTDVKYQFRHVPDTGYECSIAMGGVPICKANGLSKKKARVAARRLAVWKFIEFVVKIGIASFDEYVHFFTWYNSRVPADRRFPIDGMDHCSVADSGTNEPIANSEVLSQQNDQNPEHCVVTTNQLNTSICEMSSQQICSAFIAILDYSDIAKFEAPMCVLKVAAQLNCVQLQSPCEVFEYYTGLQEVRATIKFDSKEFSRATSAIGNIALDTASRLALCKLRKTSYTIKMKYEHFAGFIIHRNEVSEKSTTNHTQHSSNSHVCKMEDTFTVRVKRIIEDYNRRKPQSDLLFCEFNYIERSVICMVAENYHLNAYSIGGKSRNLHNVIVSRFLTAGDLLRHLVGTEDSSCKLKYEVIPPSRW